MNHSFQIDSNCETQEKQLQEIEELEWNCQAIECVKKCEEYISQYPNCKRVIPIYAHMYHYFDFLKATDIAKKLFDEDKFYFKNTYIYVYLLFDFEKRGREDLKDIYNTYKQYQGDKDIYYYMTIAIVAKQLFNFKENIQYLQQATQLFQNDKMIARIYHHQAASSHALIYINLAIKLQPNFDYNYIITARRAETQGQFERSIGEYEKLLNINPKNYAGFFEFACLYARMGNREEAKKQYNEYLKLKQYFPRQIFSYLLWRIKDQNKIEEQEKQVLVNLIKEAFKTEQENTHNQMIYKLYCDNITLFSSSNQQITQIREVLQFYYQNHIKGYLLISQTKSQKPFFNLLISEANLCLQSLFQLLAYKQHIQSQISFMPKYQIWDLFID